MAFPDGWPTRAPITVPAAQVGAGGVSSFPMLLPTTLPDDVIAALAYSDGRDIRLSVDGLTTIPHELVSIDTVAKTLQVWGLVPTLLSSADNTLYLYCGNAAATMPSAAEQQATWSGAYRRLHLSDNAASTTVVDAAGIADGVAARNTSLFSTAGKVGNALLFNGTSDLVNLGDLTDIEGASQLTVSAWVQPVALTAGNPGLFAKTSATACLDCLLWDTLGNVFLRVGPGTGYGYSTSAPLAAGVWAKWTMVFDGTQVGTARLKCYINGVNVPLTYNGVPEAAIMANAINANVGRYTFGNTFLNSVIDEMLLSRTAHTLPWDLTEFNNQYAPNTFATFGPVESVGGGLSIAPKRRKALWLPGSPIVSLPNAQKQRRDRYNNA